MIEVAYWILAFIAVILWIIPLSAFVTYQQMQISELTNQVNGLLDWGQEITDAVNEAAGHEAGDTEEKDGAIGFRG